MTFYSDRVQEITQSQKYEQHLIHQAICAKHWMDNHFSEQISLNVLAKEVGVSKFHFIRIFKKFYGRTPHQYLQERRIQASKNLLKSGASVTETCYSVGFSSLSSFSILFKNSTGKSPSYYQKQFSITNIHKKHSSLPYKQSYSL